MARTAMARLRGDDRGLGMVLVLAMGGVLSTLMIVTTTIALRSLESSREHVSFESALAVADGGVDSLLARARTTYVTTGSDGYVTPSPSDPTCSQAVVAWPWPTSQPTAEQERSWARSVLETLAATEACRTRTPNGDVVLLKPSGRQSVYTMAFAPAYGAAEVKTRLLKAEYIFQPFAPQHAILTQGSMALGSSTKVTTVPGADPALAAVHSNGTITVQSGNPEVYGPVTQSAPDPTSESNKFYANDGGDVAGAPKETIPFGGAREVWTLNHASSVPGGWYDLCPDGTVQRATGTSPCTAPVGDVWADLSTGGSFRGWKFDGSGTVPLWLATSGIKVNGFSGTYYVHEGDARDIASNAGDPVPNLTVIASSVSPVPTTSPCTKVGGNIDWGSIDPAAPSLQDTWLIADQDLRTSANYQAGSSDGTTVISGLFLAGDQVEMSTSSNGAYGAVVAADQCDPPDGTTLVDGNSIKNPSIYYDPNAKAPFTNVINNTAWLEYGV
jgi:hypothetical protein